MPKCPKCGRRQSERNAPFGMPKLPKPPKMPGFSEVEQYKVICRNCGFIYYVDVKEEENEEEEEEENKGTRRTRER